MQVLSLRYSYLSSFIPLCIVYHFTKSFPLSNESCPFRWKHLSHSCFFMCIYYCVSTGCTWSVSSWLQKQPCCYAQWFSIMEALDKKKKIFFLEIAPSICRGGAWQKHPPLQCCVYVSCSKDKHGWSMGVHEALKCLLACKPNRTPARARHPKPAHDCSIWNRCWHVA